MSTWMKNIVVVVAVVCGMHVSASAQLKIVEIPDTVSRYTTVKGMVSAPDGSVVLFSDHEYDWWTFGGFKHTRWFARIHRVYQDGTVQHLGTYSNGNNEHEPGTRFSRLAVLNDTIVFQLDDQHDAQSPTRVGVLELASDSIFGSEVYPRVFYVCDSRRVAIGERRGGMSTLVDIYTGEVLDTQNVYGEIVGLGPIIARRVGNDSAFIERTCTSVSVGLRVPYYNWTSSFDIGHNGTFYLYERDTAASHQIVGISWSTDMGATFSKVLRIGSVKEYSEMSDGGHVVLSQHTIGPKYRVSFADRYGEPRYGYYGAPDTLRIEAIDARDRDNVRLGVNWYDSTGKAHVGVAFLDPNVSVAEEMQTPSLLTWAAYTTIGQYVASGEGAFDAALLDRGMYIVVEGGKARLVMKQ